MSWRSRPVTVGLGLASRRRPRGAPPTGLRSEGARNERSSDEGRRRVQAPREGRSKAIRQEGSTWHLPGQLARRTRCAASWASEAAVGVFTLCVGPGFPGHSGAAGQRSRGRAGRQRAGNPAAVQRWKPAGPGPEPAGSVLELVLRASCPGNSGTRWPTGSRCGVTSAAAGQLGGADAVSGVIGSVLGVAAGASPRCAGTAGSTRSARSCAGRDVAAGVRDRHQAGDPARHRCSTCCPHSCSRRAPTPGSSPSS